jgi:hypothetical protein
MITRRRLIRAAAASVLAAPAIIKVKSLEEVCQKQGFPGVNSLTATDNLPDPFLLNYPINLHATQR